MDKITNFRQLEIWKKGIEIVKLVYRYTNSFPKSEIYGLTSQMRRAAVSIPSNIAEGFNRYHNKEYRQFLFISLGSCAELETQLEISFELSYIDVETKDKIILLITSESKMIHSLISKIS